MSEHKSQKDLSADLNKCVLKTTSYIGLHQGDTSNIWKKELKKGEKLKTSQSNAEYKV